MRRQAMSKAEKLNFYRASTLKDQFFTAADSGRYKYYTLQFVNGFLLDGQESGLQMRMINK